MTLGQKIFIGCLWGFVFLLAGGTLWASFAPGGMFQ